MNINKIKGIIALTRWTEVYDYTIGLTLLAVVFAGSIWQWNILLIIFINIIGQCFAFMINDVEDAEDDATNPKKLKRNPISNKTLSKKEGYIYSAIAALVFIILFTILAIKYQPFTMAMIALTTLITMFLYSWKKVRFKSMPVLDIFSHLYMLSGAPFLLAYFCFRTSLDWLGWLGLGIVLAISFYGVIENQIRDFETDRKTNINNSASFIGIKWAKVLQITMLVSAVLMILVYIFTLPQKLLVLLQIAGLFLLLSLYPAIKFLLTKNKTNLKQDMHRVVLFGGYITLLLKILNII